MKSKKFILNFFILLIGVVILSPLFFSTPVYAGDDGTGYWHYSEVVDSWNEVGFTTFGTGDSKYYVVNYAGYSHGVITITTDSDDAFGSISIYGKNYTYSGRVTTHIETSTRATWQVKQNKYNPGTGPESYEPPFNLNDTRGSFTYNIPESSDFININLGYKGATTNFSNYDTSTGHWVDPNIWFCFNQTTFSDNNTNDVYIMEVPIGNNTIKPEDIEIAYYSTFNNKPNKAVLSNLYIQQTVSKLYIYFTLNEDFAAWPYGTGILCLKVNHKVYLYNNTFKFYKVKYQTDMYYDLITDIKLWKFLDQYTDKPDESDHLDNSNNLFNSSSQQMMDLEDQLQGDFNSAIGNITVPDNPFGSMGNMFGNSSRFLVHMFNEFTLNHGSPFGSVITFSLLLGLAMLMIGKKGSK